MELLIGGDFYISDRFRGKSLFDASVIALFSAADYRIVNLEAPLTAGAKRNRILKTGPHVSATPEAALPSLSKLKVDLVTMANNHIMDYGRPGLADTLAALKSGGIDSVGAGMNLAEAREPFVLEKEGIRLTVLNFAENEWAGAGRDKPGANPLDPIENSGQIREARKESDFVIVVIHGGHQFFHYPSPRMVKRYRFLAESGASAIVGHHPHCIGGREVHGGVPIFYSLGNFLFTERLDWEPWYTGLLLRLHLRKNEDVSWDLVPVRQSRNDHILRVLEGEDREAVESELETYGRAIADPSSLDRAWKAYLTDRERYYLNAFSPLNLVRNKFLLSGIKKLGLDRIFYTKKHYAQVLNQLRCEAHAEASRSVVEDFLEK